MYKPIWGLVFKCYSSGIQFNSIQFSQQYSNQRNVRKEKKRSNKNTIYNGVQFKKMPTSPRLSTSNNWGWAKTLKNSFTLVELGPLHKNGLPRLSVTRVTTHSKMWVTTHSKQEVSDNTLKKKMSTTAQERWALKLKNRITRRSRMIKLGE
jgi:hypothetical protein